MDISSYVKDDVCLIERSTCSVSTPAAHTSDSVSMNREYYTELLRSEEIEAASRKRFKGRSTAYPQVDYHTLVLWCLSTDSYDVCGDKINMVSDRDVELAWEFIDTFKVSSSQLCSRMVSKGVGGRSAEGFRRTRGARRRDHRPSRGGGIGLRTKPSIAKGAHIDYSHDTVNDTMAEDAFYWLRRRDT